MRYQLLRGYDKEKGALENVSEKIHIKGYKREGGRARDLYWLDFGDHILFLNSSHYHTHMHGQLT